MTRQQHQTSPLLEETTAATTPLLPSNESALVDTPLGISSSHVCFRATATLTSEPFPVSSSETLTNFFADNRHLFLPKGHRSKQKFPEEQRELVEIDTSVEMRVLQVRSVVLLDSQLLVDATNEMPSYRFQLLDSKLSATGNPILLRLFRRLVSSTYQEMGVEPKRLRRRQGLWGSKSEQREKAIHTASNTVISCQPMSDDNNNNNNMALASKATLEIQMRVPESIAKFAVSLGPQMNDALELFLQKQMSKSVERFRCAFLEQYPDVVSSLVDGTVNE